MQGIKHDQEKLKYHLIPVIAYKALASVLTFGAKKYSEDNWQKVDNFNNRYYSALMRHLTAWLEGEKIDPESGYPHLWHAFTNLMFLIWKENNN